MDSDTQADGGIEPAVGSGAGAGSDPDPPLYKFGTTSARLRSLSHTVFIVGGAYIAAIAGQVAAIQALVITGIVQLPGQIESTGDLPTLAAVASFGVFYVGFYAVGIGYLRWQSEGSSLSSSLFEIRIPTLRDVGWIVLGLVGLIASLVVVAGILSQFGLEQAENVSLVSGRENPELLLYLIPIALLLNGPAEEFIFRGLLQGLFREAYGIVPGIAITAALFGVVHVLALSGSGSSILVTLATLSVLGALLGLVYEKTQNLVVPALIHGLFNAIQFFLFYLQTTGAFEAAV